MSFGDQSFPETWIQVPPPLVVSLTGKFTVIACIACFPQFGGFFFCFAVLCFLIVFFMWVLSQLSWKFSQGRDHVCFIHCVKCLSLSIALPYCLAAPWNSVPGVESCVRKPAGPMPEPQEALPPPCKKPSQLLDSASCLGPVLQGSSPSSCQDRWLSFPTGSLMGC